MPEVWKLVETFWITISQKNTGDQCHARLSWQTLFVGLGPAPKAEASKARPAGSNDPGEFLTPNLRQSFSRKVRFKDSSSKLRPKNSNGQVRKELLTVKFHLRECLV